MFAKSDCPRFYFDESLLGIGKVMERARRDVVYPGHPNFDVPCGLTDVEWIPKVAEHNLVAILRDKRALTRPAERESMREHGLRAIWLAGKRDMNTWGYLTLLVRYWERIETEVASRGDGPWFLAVHPTSGIKPLEVRSPQGTRQP